MKIISPWIQLTNRCNLSCNYCFIDRNQLDMKESIFDNICKIYSTIFENDTNINIQFRLAGGEPLIVFNNIKDRIETLIINYGNRFSCELITNGHLLDKDILSFIQKYNKYIGLCLSIDSVDKYEKNVSNIDWKLIKQYAPDIGISISTVLIDNGDYISDLASFILKKSYYWDINLNKIFEGEYNNKKIYYNLDKLFKVIKKHKYNIKTIQFNGIDFNKNKGCGAGEKLIAHDVNGIKYNCQTIFNNINSIEYDRSKCNNCNIIEYCGFGCKYNNIKNRKHNFCDIVKYYFLKGVEYAVSL